MFALAANSWSARAKIATDSCRVLIASVAGLGAWLTTLVLILITGRTRRNHAATKDRFIEYDGEDSLL